MASDKTTIGRLGLVFAWAVAINYAWEMAQMPLYENMPFTELGSWLMCFRASLGDGVIVLTIWGIGAALYRRAGWFTPLRIGNAAVLVVSGVVIAVAIEIHAISTGRWAYSALMPIVPVVEAGLSPILQLILLPVLSMKAAGLRAPPGR